MTNHELSIDQELTQEELSMLNGSRAYRVQPGTYYTDFPGEIILAYKDCLAKRGKSGLGGYYLDGIWVMA